MRVVDFVNKAGGLNGGSHAAEREQMGLRAKFNIAISVAFLVGFAIAAFVLHKVFVDQARDEVMQNARIMITAADAIRDYTAVDLGPLLPMEHGGKFVAETVPAFAAQQTFKYVRGVFPGYIYREPTLNPTNPADHAETWEADIIQLFRNDSTKDEVVTERDAATGPTLNLARPITIKQDACLACHSTPWAAPPAQIKSYGTTNGFGWKSNETIGAQLVSVPMAIPLEIARRTYITFLIILVAVFAIIVIILNALLEYVVVRPVKRVSAMADAVSLGEEDVEPYVKPGNDEISSLSVSFNRMRESLKQAMEIIR